MWLLGMGWVFGRNIFHFVGRNADVLKKRGAADVILGYWLVGIEDILWQEMGPPGGHLFHDYPTKHNTFAGGCHERSILIHRMTPTRWGRHFRPDTCQMTCPAEPVEGDD